MFLRLIRTVFRIVLKIVARVEIEGYGNLPPSGGAIIAVNHLGRLDAMLGVILSEREDIILMVADKYKDVPIWHWFGTRLNAIWLNRDQADLRSMREAYRRIRAGGILGIAPEGTRSHREALVEGKPGAAYLAAKSGVPIIPAGLAGTEDRIVKQRLKRLRRLDIKIRIGAPFKLPPIDRLDRDASLAQGTEEIMCRIAAMLPPAYRGVYHDHPRLHELLEQQEADLREPAP